MTVPGWEPEPPPDNARPADSGRPGPLRVFFVRHGEAGLRSAWTGNDSERPLTRHGHRQVRLVAKRLVQLGVKPDVILTSPYTRAFETAAIIGQVFGMEDKVVVEPALQPGAHLTKLTPLIGAHQDANAVMLVGHEPDFSSLIAALCDGGRVALEKAGVAEVQLDHARVFHGVLVWLAQPDHLVRRTASMGASSCAEREGSG